MNKRNIHIRKTAMQHLKPQQKPRRNKTHSPREAQGKGRRLNTEVMRA